MTAVGILPTEMGFSVMRMSAMIPSPGETGSVGEDADEEVKAIVDDGDTEAGTRIRSSDVEKHIEKKKKQRNNAQSSPHSNVDRINGVECSRVGQKSSAPSSQFVILDHNVRPRFTINPPTNYFALPQ